MKKLQLLLVALIVTVFSFGHDDEKDPIVLSIDGEGIHKSEFLYIYLKNNPNPSYKKADLDEYMELFINYKLKVKEAETLGYDTIPKLVSELATYRQQLSLPYMVDKDQNERLVKEAYERTTQEVKASHILIRLKPNPSPADTLAAYNKCMTLRKRIEGGENFGDVASGKGGSEDPSAKTNKGDLGYFSALQMVYAFEDAAFKTEVGKMTMPIRTRFGYHLIQVVDKRAARGKIKASHIMVLANDEMSDAELKSAEKKISEIYDLLEKGENFEGLARKYSDDQSSKSKGGQLPVFGAGSKQRMVPQFEEAAFGITEDGNYSKPVRTAYGYHIIKRVQLIPVPSYENMYRELKLKVEKDIRAQSTKESFLNKLKKEYNYQDDNAAKAIEYFYSIDRNKLMTGRWKGLENDIQSAEIMFAFSDLFYTVGDFENYLTGLNITSLNVPLNIYLQNTYKVWAKNALLKYEDERLEEKYPEFKSLIQEYRDGILVFEIMQNEIWNKASKDSVGIQSYYTEHQNEFTYPVRYDGELYKCKDKETAESVYALIETDTMNYGQIQEYINKDSQLNLKVKKHIFNSETTEAFKKGKKTRSFKAGLNKTYSLDGEYYIMKVNEVMAPRNRKFKEAKGLVTAAYQGELEKNWLTKLRSTYKVEVHTDALYAVGD